MLGWGEAGAFQKVEHRHGVGLVALACLARSSQVLALLVRVPAQVFLAVALHERELQCPPAQANYGDPNQLLLEEELENGHASVELILQDQNVRPALMITADQVGVPQ